MSAYAIHLQNCYIRARIEGFDGLAFALAQLLQEELVR